VRNVTNVTLEPVRRLVAGVDRSAGVAGAGGAGAVAKNLTKPDISKPV